MTPAPAPWLALEALLRDLAQRIASDLVVRVTRAAFVRADLAVRPFDGGFELLLAVGRAAGYAGHRFSTVARELEVVEYCGALAALYREERFGELAAEYFGRVGLRYLRERIDADPAGRAALFQRGYRAGCGAAPRCALRAGRL